MSSSLQADDVVERNVGQWGGRVSSLQLLDVEARIRLGRAFSVLSSPSKPLEMEAIRLSALLALGAGLTAALDALQDGLTVLVELELGDDHLGGVDAEGDALAVGLLAVDALNVDDVLETVHRGDLALTALVGTADDGDLVVLADGDAADLQILCQYKQTSERGFRRRKGIMANVRCTSHGAPWREGRS